MKQPYKKILTVLFFLSLLLFQNLSWAEPLKLPVLLPEHQDSLPAFSLVATAYGFIWAAVFVFVGTIAWRYRKLGQKIKALQAKIESLTPTNP